MTLLRMLEIVALVACILVVSKFLDEYLVGLMEKRREAKRREKGKK